MNARVHLYLSPHLDDAVLSCGGRIWRQAQAGERVRVVTIFAGKLAPDVPLSPFAQALHTIWASTDPVVARQEEDAAALARLGAQSTYWPYTDCIYRQDPDDRLPYDSEDALFGEVHPSDEALIVELAERFRALALERVGAIYAPLAVGRHVDHQIVRRAVEGLAGVTYYEDYPYAEKPEATEAALGGGTVPPPEEGEQPVPPCVVRPVLSASIGSARALSKDEVRRREFSEQWQAELVALSPQALEAKVAAIACYSSQFISLGWTDAVEMAAAVRAFAWWVGRDRPAERYWRHV